MSDRCRCALLCSLASLLPAVLSAQSAELSGFVKDRSEKSIAGARLELRSRDRGIRLRTISNEEGVYSFPGLKPGTYDATVQADGFRTLTRDGIFLSVGDRAGLDFSLQLAPVLSSIEVSAATISDGAVPESLDGAVGTVVGQRFVANMPLNGRSFQSLIHLTPGVVVTPSRAETTGQFSVNGQRSNTNYFSIDGVGANFASSPYFTFGQSGGGAVPAFNILGGTNSLVSVDAMQEFHILTSSFAPEYGRTPGGQISVVTKSGTNDFHGTAAEYLRNDFFDARNWFNVVPEPKPPLRQNNFSGTLGGPIRKNHTFFFGSYEGLRLRRPRTQTGNFLTAAARAQAAPVLRPFVNAFPLPDGPVNPDGITAPLTASYSEPSGLDTVSVRVDHVTSRVVLFGRWNHAPSSQGLQTFSQLMNYRGHVDTLTGGATVLIAPSVVNDFRANWSRAENKVEDVILNLFGAVAPPASALFPAISGPDSGRAGFSLDGVSGAVRSGISVNNVQRQINLIDTLSVTSGVHLLKFGVDCRRMLPVNAPPSYTYSARISAESLLAGTVDSVLVSGNDPITVGLGNYSLFAQDSWKLSRRLTLTYGLRWEINTPPSSATRGKPLYRVTGIFDSEPPGLTPGPLWQTQFGNLAPRFGAAWMVAPNNVLRGGFGLFYDLGYGSRIPMAYSFPYSRSAVAYYDPALPFDLNGPAFTQPPVPTTLSPGQGAAAMDPHLQLPLSYQWNLAWERSLGTHQTLTATYVGSRGTRLLRKDLVIPEGSIFEKLRSQATATYNFGHSYYNALQLQFMRRLSRGLQALVTYSLSQSMDTVSTDNGDEAEGVELIGRSIQELKSQATPIAPSDFDIRQVFSTAVSWELPVPRRKAFGFLNGWTLDGIARVHSAPPLNVTFARRTPYTVFVQPDAVPGQPFWIPDANQPRGRVLNPAAFSQPAGFSGNLPRNVISGFPFSQVDAALQRRFRLNERLLLDVRAEYFNVFNHPNFGKPFTLIGLPGYWPLEDFGKVFPGDTLNEALGGGGQAGGQVGIYAPGGPRSAQFTLRLRF